MIRKAEVCSTPELSEVLVWQIKTLFPLNLWLLIETDRLLFKLDGTDQSQSMCDFSPISLLLLLLFLFDLRGHNGARLLSRFAKRISSQVYGTTDNMSIAAKPRTRLLVHTNPWSPKARASPNHLQNRDVASGPCHELVYNPKTRAENKRKYMFSFHSFSLTIFSTP